jgi:hypothetical protein
LLLFLITVEVTLLGATAGSTQLYTTSEPNCIIDSGTTLAYLRTDAYNQFVQELNDLCNQGKTLPGVCSNTLTNVNETLLTGYCFTMTSTERANFPDIIFTFDTAGNFSLPSSSYLIPYNDAIYYCLVVYNGKIDHPHMIDLI